MNSIADFSKLEPRPSVRIDRYLFNSPRRLRSALLKKASAMRLSSFVLFVCAGYLVQGRTFAYFGLPGLYPGEVLLLWTALRPGVGWWDAFASEFRAKHFLPRSLIWFLAWGLVETLRGYGGGYSIEESLRGIATHYYPLLLYVGLSATRYVSLDRIRRYFNKLNVLIGLSAVASVLLAGRYYLPWKQDVTLPGSPALPCLAFVFALAFVRRIDVGYAISSLLALLAMLLGPRSSILGGIVGLLVLLCRRNRRAITIRLLIGTVVTCAFVSVLLPPLLPNFGGRAGALTPARVTARVTAIVDRELARKIAAAAGEDDSFIETEAGTAEWRKQFWNGVIDSMATRGDWIVGHGYGFSLGSLMIGAPGFDDSIRTPHNFAVYLLGYTGLVGCAIYVCILLAFIAEVVRCPDSPIKDGILAGASSVLVMGLSGNLFETPFGAVPTYLAFGIVLALARKWKSSHSRTLVAVSHPTDAYQII